MKKCMRKKGVSLIVLVITIVVMIILATAIILALSNGEIIKKANKAKIDTEAASAKDVVAMAYADWMLDEVKIKQENEEIKTFSNYAEMKLQAAGYKVGIGENSYTVTEKGEVYEGLTEGARTAIISGIEIGQKVKYNTVLTEKSYTTDGSEQSFTGEADDTKKQTIGTNLSYTWRYIGIDEDGNLLIAADMSKEQKLSLLRATEGPVDPPVTSSNYKMTLDGKGAYLNGPKMLDTVCDALYSVEGKGTAKSINIDIVTKLLEYNGPKGSYTDENRNMIELTEPITIAQTGLVSELGSSVVTPDGKDINTYYTNFYPIIKEDTKNRITKDEIKQNLVYQDQDYWLASACVDANFYDHRIYFSVLEVNRNNVYTHPIFLSFNYAESYTNFVRPVVSLNSNVKLTPNEDKTEWTLS